MKRIESQEFFKPNLENGCLLDFEESEKTPVLVKQKFFDNPVKEEIRKPEHPHGTLLIDKIHASKPTLKDFIFACLKDNHKIYECDHFSVQVSSTGSTSEAKDEKDGPTYLKMAIVLENKKNIFAIEDINYKVKETQSN